MTDKSDFFPRRKRKGPKDLSGFTVPTPAELAEQKKDRLAKEIPEADRLYLPEAIRTQLAQFVDEDGIYPGHAVVFLKKRLDFLRRSEIPPSVFEIGRQDLPHHTAPEELDYPVLDYLTAVYFNASLFPLRSLAAIGNTAGQRRVHQMDPIVRRELARQGLLDYEKMSTSHINPNAPDVKKLRAAMFGGDMLSFVRAAVNCHDSGFKQSLFHRIVQHRLTVRADNLDELIRKASGKKDDESNTGQELRELTDPDNIDYLMQRLHTEAGPWVSQHFATDAEVVHLPNAKVEDYLEVFDHNIFWFEDWDEETTKRYLAGFAQSVEEAIELAFEGIEEAQSVNGYAELAIPAARGAQYIEMYLGTTLEQLVTETIHERLTEYISSTLYVYKDTLEGGRLPYELDQFMEELISRMSKERTAAESPELTESANEGPSHVSEPSNVIDLAAVRAQRAKVHTPEPVSPQSTLSENLNIMLREIAGQVKCVPTPLRKRFFDVSTRIGTAYVRTILHEDRKTLTTTDLYVGYKSHSKLYNLTRLNNFIMGADQGMAATQLIIDDELANLSDEEFADVFGNVMDNYNGRSFSISVFSEQYQWLGQGSYRNALAKSRDRLIHLLEDQPSIFNSDRLVQEYRRWKLNRPESE